jgi:hypothetical protein
MKGNHTRPQARAQKADRHTTERDRVGQDHVLEVDGCGGDEPSAQREVESKMRKTNVQWQRGIRQDTREHDSAAEQAAQELHERVARAHLHLAATRAAAENGIADQRNVQVRRNPGATSGAGRRRMRETHSPRESVDNDVQKASDAEAHGSAEREPEPVRQVENEHRPSV